MSIPERNYPASWHDASSFAWPELTEGSWTEFLEGMTWLVTIGWREIEGRWEPVGIQIEQKEPERAAGEDHVLTAKMVRAIPVGEFIKRGRNTHAGSAETVAQMQEAEGDHEGAAWLREYARKFTARPGRPPKLSDEHYRQVADIWNAASLGPYPAPIKAIQSAFQHLQGGRGISYATAARWAGESRRRGFLGQAKKGKPGGVGTRKPKGGTEESKPSRSNDQGREG